MDLQTVVGISLSDLKKKKNKLHHVKFDYFPCGFVDLRTNTNYNQRQHYTNAQHAVTIRGAYRLESSHEVNHRKLKN